MSRRDVFPYVPEEPKPKAKAEGKAEAETEEEAAGIKIRVAREGRGPFAVSPQFGRA